ncbi:hypothetical protein BKA66DRAFT_435411 [Pyrenochaeta sp. MPI-SDFR-AT-0127]|nr:hypothetical protein BKA66DRAFT_435411 [Pyrenochaeta sp. MPI-SDFR-AT-0127]
MSSNGHRGQAAVVISGISVGLATITVLLRLWTRYFIVRCLGIEDYCIILALICAIGLTICIGIQAEYGMGEHIWTLTPNDISNSLKAFWASLMVYYLSLGLTKSSIILQYLRVFTTRRFQIACWLVMAVVVAYTVWTIFGSIFACVPVRAFWTREPAKCINQFAMWFTNAAINILTDFAIIILPMPVIRSLNLARRQKQALMGIFAVGGFVCIVSILRLQSLVAISNSEDPTYDNPPAATWSSVETNVGIICSCLPCLRPLLTKCFPSIFPSSFQRSADSAAACGRRAYNPDSKAQSIPPSPADSKFSSASTIRVVTVVEMHMEGSEEDQPDRNNGWTEEQCTSSTERDR